MNPTEFAAAYVGAKAALDTFCELLTEYAQEHEVVAEEPYFSLNDVIRLVGVARESIEDVT